MLSNLTKVYLLARRSAVRIWRQPAQWVFPLVFPIMLLIFNSEGLAAAAQLPGFPGKAYVDFWISNPFIFGAANLATVAGSNMAMDIQSGFFNRLALSPTPGWVLALGHLGGTLVVAAFNGVVFLLVGELLGVTVLSGALGMAVMLLLGVFAVAFFAGLGTLMALKLGTTEAVEALFPIFFVFLFLSSTNFPRNLMKARWFAGIATLNPISYVVEAIRSLVVTGWDWRALGVGVAILTVLTSYVVARAASLARSRTQSLGGQ